MPTGDLKINMYNRRLLSLTGVKDQFLDFLKDTIDAGTSAMFRGNSGVVEEGQIELQDGASADEFTVDYSNASKVIVGGGQIIDISLIAGDGITDDIPFENTTSEVYYVGIKYAEIPWGIELNPRTGDPEYSALKQSYGEMGTPTSVTDNTTYIRININSITESGEDHSGRTIRVWLVDPVSGVESVAFWEGTSAYSNPDNYVDIPYSGGDGPLGQDTSINPPSTTAADYVVFEQGVTWTTVDISSDDDYAFIGTITGGVSPTYDISSQETALTNSLDGAYDGPTGSGSGRVINVDSEAVEIRSTGSSGDELGAALRIDRKNSTENGGSCLQTIQEHLDGVGFLNAQPIIHSTGGLLINNSVQVTSADVITEQGSANYVNSNISKEMDLAWLQGTPNDDGLYCILAVTSTTLQLRTLSGAVPTMTVSDNGTLTVLRARFITPAKNGFGAGGYLGFRGEPTFIGMNEDTGTPTYAGLKCIPDQSDCAHFYNSEATPLLISKINNEGMYEGLGLKVESELASSGDEDKYILDVQCEQSDGRYLPSARVGRFVNNRGQEVMRLQPHGRIADVDRFKDHFFYENITDSNLPPWYDFAADTGGALAPSALNRIGGWAKLTTGTTSGYKATMFMREHWAIALSGTRIGGLHLVADILVSSVANEPIIRVGFMKTATPDLVFWFEADADGGSPFNYTLKSDNGASGTGTEASSIGITAGKVTSLHIYIDPFYNSNAGFIGGMVGQEDVGTSDHLTGYAIPTTGGWGWYDDLLAPFIQVETGAAGASDVEIDFWEIWGDSVLTGDNTDWLS